MASDYLDGWRAASAEIKMRWLEEMTIPRPSSPRIVDDRLRRSFPRMSVARKLAWLEEANNFLWRARGRRAGRLRRLRREGKF